MTVRVKVCGITSPADAVLAAELGASAIGMIFWPGSPRAIDASRAKAIVDALPPFVSTVGVFVNQVDEARTVARALRLSAVQLHGDEDVEQCLGFDGPVIKAISVRDRTAIDAARQLPGTVTVLLDAHDPARRGGTGRPIDWAIASEIARERPVILSGGLHPGNVASAVAAVRPWAIDASSGLESAPGTKDPRKLRAFFASLHSIDMQHSADFDHDDD